MRVRIISGAPAAKHIEEREACGEVKLIEKRDLRVRINAGTRTRLAKMRS